MYRQQQKMNDKNRRSVDDSRQDNARVVRRAVQRSGWIRSTGVPHQARPCRLYVHRSCCKSVSMFLVKGAGKVKIWKEKRALYDVPCGDEQCRAVYRGSAPTRKSADAVVDQPRRASRAWRRKDVVAVLSRDAHHSWGDLDPVPPQPTSPARRHRPWNRNDVRHAMISAVPARAVMSNWKLSRSAPERPETNDERPGRDPALIPCKSRATAEQRPTSVNPGHTRSQKCIF